MQFSYSEKLIGNGNTKWIDCRGYKKLLVQFYNASEGMIMYAVGTSVTGEMVTPPEVTGQPVDSTQVVLVGTTGTAGVWGFITPYELSCDWLRVSVSGTSAENTIVITLQD